MSFGKVTECRATVEQFNKQCLQPGACSGPERVFWHAKKILTQIHTTHTGTKKKRKTKQQQKKPPKNKFIKRQTDRQTDTQARKHTHTHMQPSGPDQYMTRVNLLRTSGSPIKGLGVLIENHSSRGRQTMM